MLLVAFQNQQFLDAVSSLTLSDLLLHFHLAEFFLMTEHYLPVREYAWKGELGIPEAVDNIGNIIISVLL